MSTKKRVNDIIRSTGNRLEKTGINVAGDIAEDFLRGKLGLSKPGRGGGLPNGLKQKQSSWDATSYAAALAGATEYRPKLKFLFKVQFYFTPEVIAQFPELANNNYTFMIKQVDRPKVDFEYEDDVNQYNFRTKVLKKIKHRELTITFMDDVGNNVFDFFRTLMMIYSPITREAVKRDNKPSDVPNARRFELGSGMAFSGMESLSSGGNNNDVAIRAAVNTYAGSAMTLIRVKQIYLDPTAADGDKDKAVGANFYDFINPRLVSFDLDDLNHESSDPNLLTMQFDYDWLEMTKNAGLQSLNDGLGPISDVTVPSRTGSDISGVPPDILLGRNTKPPANTNKEKGKNNPFVNILAQAGGQIVQTVGKDLIDKSVKGLLGNGRFANSRFGKRLAGGLTDTLGSFTGDLGGLVSGGIRDSGNGFVSSLSSGADNLYAGAVRFGKGLFSDSATVGADRPSSRVDSTAPPPGGGG